MYLLILAISAVSGCSTEVLTTNIDLTEAKLTIEESNQNSESMASETEVVELKVDTFKGEWFTINYSQEFTVSPDSPIDIFDDYEFVATDEAIFTSLNGDVQFFVYSPQWGGNPKNYLNTLPNEKISSDKTTVDEIDPNRIYRWITFEDKNGKYIRSVYSKKSESTHLVFGIKYKDQATYEKYKSSYTAFKKSLIQFAD